MKHIKICKPRAKSLASDQPTHDQKLAQAQVPAQKSAKVMFVAEGIGCVPTGKIVDRD